MSLLVTQSPMFIYPSYIFHHQLCFQGDPYVRCEHPECLTDPDCPSWLACIDRECQDPCACGPNAECRVINHRQICTCLPGYEGDPGVACTRSKLHLYPIIHAFFYL